VAAWSTNVFKPGTENQLRARRLTIGLNESLHIREEWLSKRPDACHLMYVSDIHLRGRRSDHLCRQVVESARSCEIDVLLLGGDLLDGPAELGKLRDLVGALGELAPVFAVGGNHDRKVGFDRVRDAVLKGGGEWIHAGAARVSHGSRVISVSGPDAATLPEADFRVLCAHDPRAWKAARSHGYDLVLGGHLHGCQVVAFEYRDRLYPGAIFYPYCYLSHQHGSTRLVVSRGVSDLVPIRWRCPREVVLCHV
jgi:predicted MPP superfamily phosphohydrolase